MVSQRQQWSWALLLLEGICHATMNGEYHIANPVPGGASPAVFHRGEYVDVYSHNISTVYSEVYWTQQPSVALPAELVARFNNKLIALTGYEADSVRLLPDGSEEHVPLYEQYNHHHNAYLIGKAAALVDVGPTGSKMMHTHGGVKARWELRDRPVPSNRRTGGALLNQSAAAPYATAAFLVDGNGGEYRKSLHATAQGTAMLVHSPVSFELQPMMINTKNPNPGKGPGQWDLYPVAAYGRHRGAKAPEHSLYSPLLECPCTDRKKRIITQHNTVDTGTCPAAVNSSEACFSAAAALGLVPTVHNMSVHNSAMPGGCYVMSTLDGYETYFNQAVSKATCGSTALPARSKGSHRSSGVSLSLSLDGAAGCSPVRNQLNGSWVYSGAPYGPNNRTSAPYTMQLTEEPGRSGVFTVEGSACSGCRGVLKDGVLTIAAWEGLNATVSSDFLSMKWSNGVVWKHSPTCTGQVNITLKGAADVWFGVGFDADTMSDKPYSIIIDGDGKATERVMGDHEAGIQLNSSLTVLSNSVVDGARTVVVQRTLAGLSKQHFSFDATASALPIITAVGSTKELAYHTERTGATLALVQVGAPLCVCESFGHTSGSIDGIPFSNQCRPMPQSSLLRDANDVCDISTYWGGLKCCSHKSILLDTNQTVPTEVDTYRMKFRIYFEEYTNQSHAFFMFWTNELGAGEYDVPQCAEGTPVDQCVHTTESYFTPRDSMRKCSSLSDVWCAPGWDENKDVMLLRAGTHCHAPGCINETLYNAETGEVICYNEPLVGQGQQPAFDDREYAVGIPPCFWGPEGDGLMPPPRLKLDTKLHSVKHANSTYYHLGVMAQWQMRGAWVDAA